MRVALLTPDPDYPHEWAWAFDVEAAVLRAAGIEVVAVPWTRWDGSIDVDLVLPLVAWGYNLDYARWIAFLERAEGAGWPMLNPPGLLRWNGDKAYLAELFAKGIPTVETIPVAALDPAAFDAARAALGGGCIVAKPAIGGGGDDTFRLDPDAPMPPALAGRATMIQRFLPTIHDGEWSLILFGGTLSHCILKRPAPGHFLVQPQHGGTEQRVAPPPQALDLAHAALAAAPGEALYARVDIIADTDGALKLMELELIEPALFLHHAADRGGAFAAAVAGAISARR